MHLDLRDVIHLVLSQYFLFVQSVEQEKGGPSSKDNRRLQVPYDFLGDKVIRLRLSGPERMFPEVFNRFKKFGLITHIHVQ